MLGFLKTFLKLIPRILPIFKSIISLLDFYKMIKIESHYKAKKMVLDKLAKKVKEEVDEKIVESLKDRISIIKGK